jgi:hypothetical protein
MVSLSWFFSAMRCLAGDDQQRDEGGDIQVDDACALGCR